MLEEWAPIAFNLVEYRDGVFILAGIDEIQTMLDDQIVKTQVHFQIIGYYHLTVFIGTLHCYSNRLKKF